MQIVIRSVLMVLFAVVLRASGLDAFTIDFEDLSEGVSLGTQYRTLGVEFEGGLVCEAGSMLFEDDFPPHSGTKVAVVAEQGLIMNMTDATNKVEGYFTYSAPLTAYFYGPAGDLIGSVASLFPSNNVLGGEPGASPNELISFTSSRQISRAVFSAGDGTGSFTEDDITVTNVPETHSLLLLLSGLLSLLWVRPTEKSCGRPATRLYMRRLQASVARAGARREAPMFNRLAPCVWIMLILAVVMCGFSVTGIRVAHAAKIVENPTAYPGIVYVGIPVDVRITVSISQDPNLVNSSVNLLRIEGAGSRKVIDKLYDDGTHGDAMAGDGIFTTIIRVNETTAGVLRFQVSAGYKGDPLRQVSPVLSVEVRENPNFERIWFDFLAITASRNTEGSLQYFTTTTRPRFKQLYQDAGIEAIASDLRAAGPLTLMEIGDTYAVFSFQSTIEGIARQGDVSFELDLDGVWRLSRLGFSQR